MDHAKKLHAHMVITGLILNPVEANKLLNLLTVSSFGSLMYAQNVFDRIPKKSCDLFLYNNMIKAHSMSSTSAPNSLLLFQSLIRDSGFWPNQYTFVFLFKACGNGLGVCEGEQVRVHALKLGLEENLFVANSLIGMYAGWGLVNEATRVFDSRVVRDMFSWNIMLNGYIQSHKMDEAKEFFDKMPKQDVVSWSSLMAGYVQVRKWVTAPFSKANLSF